MNYLNELFSHPSFDGTLAQIAGGLILASIMGLAMAIVLKAVGL